MYVLPSKSTPKMQAGSPAHRLPLPRPRPGPTTIAAHSRPAQGSTSLTATRNRDQTLHTGSVSAALAGGQGEEGAVLAPGHPQSDEPLALAALHRGAQPEISPQLTIPETSRMDYGLDGPGWGQQPRFKATNLCWGWGVPGCCGEQCLLRSRVGLL